MAGGFPCARISRCLFAHMSLNAGSRDGGGDELIPVHQVDSVAFVRSLHIDAARVIEDHLRPYGPEHPEPLLYLPNVRIVKLDILGGSHIRAMITDAEGGPWVKAMAFRAAESRIGDAASLTYAGGGPALTGDSASGPVARPETLFLHSDAAHLAFRGMAVIWRRGVFFDLSGSFISYKHENCLIFLDFGAVNG